MTTQTPGHALGVPMKRKEDPRFLRGKGQYVDDLTFPGGSLGSPTILVGEMTVGGR